ncbi:MAG: hypothetical protein RIQ93_1027 [Verrucomicrobiota bacterium]
MKTEFRKRVAALPGFLAALVAAWGAESRSATDASTAQRAEYIQAVTRADGSGLRAWQHPYPTEAEATFRTRMEARKSEMLQRREPVAHPTLLGWEERERAKQTIAATEWGKAIAARWRQTADAILSQPDDYVARMIEEQTPWYEYGFTCPNCVDRLSQEGSGRNVAWDWRQPDQLRCTACQHVYPSREYPETGVLNAPRMGQKFTFYLNSRERANMSDRSGKLAYQWIGTKPVHMSFSGTIRQMKSAFMISALEPLAYSYFLTGDSRYAAQVVAILQRLAHCYRHWLYHDYWNTVADCDPLYAAWHDTKLPLEFKRNLSTNNYRNDTLESAKMLQTFWGAGRLYPSTDGMGSIYTIALAYDLTREARDAGGHPVWQPAAREKVERDLFLEWLFTGEKYLGGPGKAELHNNKVPRIYHAMAAAGRVLGLPEYCDVAMQGYETLRDRAFRYDGFSDESAGYTSMYLSETLPIVERLHGYQWPERFSTRRATGDPYRSDGKLRQIYRASLDHLTPAREFIPFEDTGQSGAPSRDFVEFGLKRYPELFGGEAALLLGRTRETTTSPSAGAGGRSGSRSGRGPGEWALFNLNPESLAGNAPRELPEIYFPAWMTAILRHGSGPQGAVAALNFSPEGNHRQADNLTLWYMDAGDRILGDLGYVGDTPHLAWIKSTKSHNLVVVDDAEQRFHKPGQPRRPKMEMMITTPRLSAVEASSDAYAQCADYRRQITLIKGPAGATFLVDIFRVKGGNKHTYRIWSELASSWGKDSRLEFAGLQMPPEPPLPQVGASLKREDIYGLRDIRVVPQPNDQWQAKWAEEGRAYRLWNLTPATSVQASNGPGQESHSPAGRRVRFVDVVREGQSMDSVFVTVHEPLGKDGSTVIRRVERLATPPAAGPDAVALSIDSVWGRYVVLSGFASAAEVSNVRFAGRLGVLGLPNSGPPWIAAVEAATCQHKDFGFAQKPFAWTGDRTHFDPRHILATRSAPDGMPLLPPGCQNWVLVNDGENQTAFPVAAFDTKSITITERFPMPDTALPQFHLPGLFYAERAQASAVPRQSAQRQGAAK